MAEASNYIMLAWSQNRPDSLSQPISTPCAPNFYFSNFRYLVVTKPSPYFSVSDGNNVIYTGYSVASKLRVYIQIYLTTRPSGVITAGVVNNSKTGCYREAELEVVRNTFSSDYPYIGNAIVILDGSNPNVDPTGSPESWLVFLRAVTGALPIYSGTGRPNLAYISFTPYV